MQNQLTQRQLAQLSDLSDTYMSQLERQSSGSPLRRLHSAVSVSSIAD
jgi:transcriptional regulator with XRE-family HTH domain